jgi:hypothetical protein
MRAILDEDLHPIKSTPGSAEGAVWGRILIQFPEYWTIATAVAFIIASGLFTTKFVLGFTNPAAVFGLVPRFDAGWLILLWLMLKLMG